MRKGKLCHLTRLKSCMIWKVQKETQLGLTLVRHNLITLYIIVCSANILCI